MKGTKIGGAIPAKLGANTKIARAIAKVIRESLIQCSKFTKRIPSMIQNTATAKGVFSCPNKPDSKLINTIAKATISTDRIAIAAQ
ncbi:MAG: hypothetical protein MSA26_10625 [Lachnospiraceae bacterium]|nr:hypothetical protein [Lachnospiraceae bacterium]